MAGEVAAENPSGTPARGDFVIRHWRPRALDLRRAFPNGGGDIERRPRGEEGTGYTSLRDLLDSPPSPSGTRFPATLSASGEILIRNRLVKQAAHAYLQPTPSAAEYDRRRRRRRSIWRVLAVLTCGLAAEPLESCIEFLRRLLRCPQR